MLVQNVIKLGLVVSPTVRENGELEQAADVLENEVRNASETPSDEILPHFGLSPQFYHLVPACGYLGDCPASPR